MKAQRLFIACALIAVVFRRGLVAGDTVQNECANAFPKVTTCLDFATGKQDAPTKECCSSASDLKDTNPVCLCYIIQQIHNGSIPQIKSMGLQEARLLQLPSACKLTNASVTQCPKLLNLPPSSPDAAIFTNSTATTSGSGVATPASPDTSSTTKADSNSGAAHKHAPSVLVAIFFTAFPLGLDIMLSFST